MHELIHKVMNAEIGCDEYLAGFCYLPPAACSQFGVVMDIDVVGSIGPRDLVCEVHLYSQDGSPIREVEANWAFSNKLGARYQYLPAMEQSGSISLRTFQSALPFSAARVHVRPWQLKEGQGRIDIKRCLVTESITVDRASFLVYHELRSLETGK